jgi:transcriptional regulator NrdR family protein
MEETLLKETKKVKSNNLSVTKRNGYAEEFNAEKINKVLLWATNGISEVSANQ